MLWLTVWHKLLSLFCWCYKSGPYLCDELNGTATSFSTDAVWPSIINYRIVVVVGVKIDDDELTEPSTALVVVSMWALLQSVTSANRKYVPTWRRRTGLCWAQ